MLDGVVRFCECIFNNVAQIFIQLLTVYRGSTYDVDDVQGSVGHIAGHQTQSQFCNSNHNNYSPAGVGVAGSQGHLNHALSSSGHVYGYHGDSRSSLDRLQAEGCPATVDVADLLRQGYAVSELMSEINSDCGV